MELEPGIHLTSHDCPFVVDEERAKWYHKVTCVLRYLAYFTVTQPDLQYTTLELATACFNANPGLCEPWTPWLSQAQTGQGLIPCQPAYLFQVEIDNKWKIFVLKYFPHFSKYFRSV